MELTEAVIVNKIFKLNILLDNFDNNFAARYLRQIIMSSISLNNLEETERAYQFGKSLSTISISII